MFTENILFLSLHRFPYEPANHISQNGHLEIFISAQNIYFGYTNVVHILIMLRYKRIFLNQ